MTWSGSGAGDGDSVFDDLDRIRAPVALAAHLRELAQRIDRASMAADHLAAVLGGDGELQLDGVAGEHGLRGGDALRVVDQQADDRDAAETLRGLRLEVARTAVPPPPAGSHYFFELVGCRCVTADGDELGTVAEILESGGGLLLEVDRGGGTGIRIPYAESFVAEIDIADRRIVVTLPEELLETCAFRY